MGHRPCLIEGTFQEGSRLSHNTDDRMLFSAFLRSKQRGRGWKPQGGLLEAGSPDSNPKGSKGVGQVKKAPGSKKPRGETLASG